MNDAHLRISRVLVPTGTYLVNTELSSLKREIVKNLNKCKSGPRDYTMILTGDPASTAIIAQRQFLCGKNAGVTISSSFLAFLCKMLMIVLALYLKCKFVHKRIQEYPLNHEFLTFMGADLRAL